MQNGSSLVKRLSQLALPLLLLMVAILSARPAISKAVSTQIDLVGPAGSGQFGKAVFALPNGNIVVTDPGYSVGANTNVGAVYLYDGHTGALISALTGSTTNDRVGHYGIVPLSNSDYVVRSPDWANGTALKAGAVTRCSGTSGCSGVVSSANSLVGSTANDQVGYYYGATLLTNGNYVVRSPNWNNGAVTKAGAVTWCSGMSGCMGVVSSANSLVGSTTNDQVGYSQVLTLTNGNYVVNSPYWNNGTATRAGAVTWCSGMSGCTGVVSSSNSLVGSATDDWAGNAGVKLLDNDNYVVNSLYWNNGPATRAGAVTWCSGTLGCTGVISSTNSLVGSTTNDQVGGETYITPPGNDNYVVNSPAWDNGAVANAGAVTWCSGTLGCMGTVSITNSLVGSVADDRIGNFGITLLSNGNYVVKSPYWNNGPATSAGAVTWCSETLGCTGTVSTTNSLVGSTIDDQVGKDGITLLGNGNYVVNSPDWNNGTAAGAGAVTWCNGALGCVGMVSPANSLVGSTTNDWVGGYGPPYNNILVLGNNNYVVRSPLWNNGAAERAGAVTWCSGTSGCRGIVSSTNSLVGSTLDDRVGSYDITLLNDGNYVVPNPDWDNGTVMDVGAVTWCSGTMDCRGVISTTNSLVGSTTSARVGQGGITALSNGNYVLRSPYWDNGTTLDAGAVTWCSGILGCTGVISTTNSLIGSTVDDEVGDHGIAALNNGSYVVLSPKWNNGAVADVGAATWCDGLVGCTGAISHTNSLIGNTANDRLSLNATALDNGNYLLWSPYWSNGLTTSAGAITWCNGTTSCAGSITTLNSVLGQAASGGLTMTSAFDSANSQLIVGRPADNRVTLFKLDPPPTITGFTPASSRVGANVIITGTNFTGTVGVMFNWTYASDFKVLSSTLLTATVPPSATAGPIRVNTPGGTAVSNTDFSVYSSNSWYVALPPLGDDTNDCLSLAAPCATINGAVTKASADDTINIAAGTYTENITVTMPLNFVGAGANSTIVDGNHVDRVFNIVSGTVSIADLTVQHGNTSSDGGGIYAADRLTLTNVNVMSNTATGNGGGVKVDRALILNSSRFINNTAHEGGGVYLSGDNSAYGQLYNILLAGNTATSNRGNALFVDAWYVLLAHGTIASPTLGNGSAIYGNVNNWSINNTLIASYTVGYEQAANPRGWLYAYSTLFSGVITPYVGSNINIGSTSFSGEAGFIDPFGGNYHLTASSDAINRIIYDDAATDLDGNPRPVGCGYDIGAYEYQAAPDCMLTINVVGTGVVTPTAGIHSYPYGATATLTAVTSAPWSFGGWSGEEGGAAYSTRILMNTDKVITATFGLPSCYATPDNGLTIESSPNYAALQRAADRAPADGTVKVAGTCTGVSGYKNMLYVGKSLTLLGGYTVTNWLTSHPLTQPTVLDAQHAGRAIHLYAYFAGLTVADLAVQNGNSEDYGGGIYSSGLLTLTNVNVLSNTATSSGGGVWVQRNATIMGGLFQNNRSITLNGGGLDAWGSLNLTGTQFTNNAAYQGGGIYLDGSFGWASSYLANVILAGNTATSTQGNAVFAEAGDVSLYHGTIVSPTHGSGSAIYGYNNDWFIYNTLVASYTVGYEQAADAAGWLYEYRTLFSDVITPYVGSNIDIDSHSFSGPAGFVDPIGGDYHLTADSEAINRGMEMSTPIAKDFDHNPRPAGCGYDIGAYEYQAAPDCMLTIGIVGTGSVTPTAGIHSYPYGAVVPLTASTSAPWSFAGWSGDVTSPANFASVYMLGDQSVVATFVAHRVYLPLVLK